ncbi:MAG: hypothetical protein N2561_09075 [Bacteroidetes bacterium]|nr:hypothetical protein [Rhodothermia bacterium]MCS7155977.1 hypothetical protein [Bacteroidota bacterium]MCX7907665.1 hypothetical protein [Bacteroidota bacterium]MDW8137794.1 hypothetical protein [Bacteroidota bacterium]MDW8286355.1 hypothetical protein [Bacteroidota bacterium]
MDSWSTMSLIWAVALSILALHGGRRAWMRYRNGDYDLIRLLGLWGGLLLGCALLWLGYWTIRGAI